jgi:hypothetical protein
VVFLIDSNPNILRVRLGSDFPVITVSWLLIGSLVVITSAGADLLARSHIQMQTRSLPTLNLGVMRVEVAPGSWILPSFSVIGSFAFFRLFNAAAPGIALALALLAAGGLLLIVLVAQHYALDRNAALSQPARLGLQIITYLLAFGCFSAIYYTRFRTLYSASLIGLAGTLLAYEILQWRPQPGTFRLAALVGLLLAEATWAINYWPTTFLLAGTLLLAIFYVAVGLIQQQQAGTLGGRLIAEYGLLGSGLLLAVVVATFRF